MAIFSLADLTQRVLSRLDNNSLLYQQPEITDIINEAMRITNLMLGYNQGSIAVPGGSIANRRWYDMPYGMIIPNRVQFNGSYLEPTSINSLGRSHPNWSSDTTANTGVPVSTWIRYGLNKLGIYPADSYGGYQILVSGVTEPTPLVNQTDTVQWNSDVVNCFDLYVSSVLQLKESDQIFSQASMDYVAWQKVVKGITYAQGLKMPRYWVDQAKQSVSR